MVALFNKLRVEYRDPRSLAPHPLNARQHGKQQRQAFSDHLDSVGLVGLPVFNATTGRLIDGHMRVQEFVERNADSMPVMVVEMTEAKERVALALKDRIGAMAQYDDETLRELASLISDLTPTLQHVLAGDSEAERDALDPPPDLNPLDGDKRNLGLFPGEHFNYVVLIFKTELDWYAAQEHFKLERVADPIHPQHLAVGRVVDGGKYIMRLTGGKV